MNGLTQSNKKARRNPTTFYLTVDNSCAITHIMFSKNHYGHEITNDRHLMTSNLKAKLCQEEILNIMLFRDLTPGLLFFFCWRCPQALWCVKAHLATPRHITLGCTWKTDDFLLTR